MICKQTETRGFKTICKILAKRDQSLTPHCKQKLNDANALNPHVNHEQHAPQDFVCTVEVAVQNGYVFTYNICHLKSMYLQTEIVFFVLCACKLKENARIQTFSTVNETEGLTPHVKHKQHETKA